MLLEEGVCYDQCGLEKRFLKSEFCRGMGHPAVSNEPGTSGLCVCMCTCVCTCHKTLGS